MKRSRKISARIILFAIMASIFMTLFQNCGGSVTLQSAPKPIPKPPPEIESIPSVINVTSSTADGIYNQGSVISIQVIFSEAVFVTSTPTLTLNTTPSKTANYLSGSGTASLTFSYTVGATETSADLDYSSTTALSLNGGTIQNNKEKAAELILANPGAAGSLGANKDIVIQLQQLCVPNSTSSSGCPTISNGSSVKTCNAQGSAYGSCNSSCNNGYNISGTQPNISCNPVQICTPNSTTSTGCPTITNGLSVKTCNAQGTAYGSCSSSCNSGYNLSGIQPNITCSVAQVCTPNSTSTSGCPTITNGSSVKTCNAQGTAYGSCSSSCSTGYTASGTQPNITCSINITSVNLAAGVGHTCTIVNGGVKCWGYNGNGQLGDNSITKRLTPANVQNLTSGVQSIAAGVFHTCALTTGGGVKCWGNNGDSQLGNNSTTYSLVPVDVQGLTSGVQAIAAGSFHTCALTTEGGVKCWGGNTYGQLGNNSTINSPVPINVQGLNSGVKAIAANLNHICALTTVGGVKCWGWNIFGQLGNNSTIDSRVPVDVQGLTSGVQAITAGCYHTCAAMTSGGVKCWGYNYGGGLGNNSTTDSYVPVNVQNLTSGVQAVTAGYNHTCALTTNGAVKCWGFNSSGELGDGSIINRLTPVNVIGIP